MRHGWLLCSDVRHPYVGCVANPSCRDLRGLSCSGLSNPLGECACRTRTVAIGDFVNQQPDRPVSITSARASHSVDIHKRQTRYLLSMGIRTTCFVLAIVTTGLAAVGVRRGRRVPPVCRCRPRQRDRPAIAAGPAAFVREEHRVLEGPVDEGTGGSEDLGLESP